MILELLAPAGDKESFYAAVNNGADAVYLGLGRFNARMKAENFDAGLLSECIRYAHTFGVKVYITINTLVKDIEIPALTDEVTKAADARADAFIVQDLGVASVLAKRFPGIVLHASTQAAVNNADGAAALERLGFKRVVLARETKLADIKEIKRKTSLEIEFFVHGALCVCFSGNCYLSAAENGASGNRGQCKQLCRLPYEAVELQVQGAKTEKARGKAGIKDSGKKDKILGAGYLLSARDLCLIDSLKELADAGVTSFKIEGRMRRSGYVGETVRVYRHAIDVTFKRDTEFQQRDIYYKSTQNLYENVRENCENMLKTEKTIGKNCSKTAKNTQKTAFFRNEFDKNRQIGEMRTYRTSGSSTVLKNSSTVYSARYPENISSLRTAFSRGDFLNRAYLDGGTPENVINRISQNHTGIEIGRVRSVKPFKRLYETTIESNRALNDGDGIKLFENDKEKGSLGLGGVRKTGERLYTVITKTRAEEGWKVRLILDSEAEKQAVGAIAKIPVKMELTALTGLPVTLTVTAETLNGKTVVTQTGEPAEKAITAPLTEDGFKKQLVKTGDGLFEAEEIAVRTDGVFIPKSVLNALRRGALDNLQREITAANEQALSADCTADGIAVKTPALLKESTNLTKNGVDSLKYDILTPFYDKSALKLRFENNTEITVLSPETYSVEEVFKMIDASGLRADELALQLPNIANGRDIGILDDIVSAINGKIKYLLAENLYAFKYADIRGFELIAGRETNITNACAAAQYNALGARCVVLSAEADGDPDGVYPPLMTFAHCQYKTLTGKNCDKCPYFGDFILKSGCKKYLVSRVRIANCYFKLSAVKGL